MKLVPVDLCPEFYSALSHCQRDVLAKGRTADLSRRSQRCPGACGADNLHLYIEGTFDLLLSVIRINIPGIKLSRHILKQAEMIHRCFGKFSSVLLQYIGGDLGVGGNRHPKPVILHHETVSFRFNYSRRQSQSCLFHSLGRSLPVSARNHGNRSQRRNHNSGGNRFTIGIHRNCLPVQSPCPRSVILRNIDQADARERKRVEYSQSLALLYQACDCVSAEFPGLFTDAAKGTFCLLIYPVDTGTGKNIMELVQQRFLPQALRLLCRIPVSAACGVLSIGNHTAARRHGCGGGSPQF